jgi:PAS domain S-box-containing protein
VLKTPIDKQAKKGAERASQPSREFFSALVEYAGDGIIACDANGTLTVFNRAARELHGIAADTPSPKKWSEHYGLHHRDGSHRLPLEDLPLYRALKGDVVRDEEILIESKNGTRHRVVVSGRAIYDPAGEKLGAVVTIRAAAEPDEAVERTLQQIREDAVRGEAADAERRISVILEGAQRAREGAVRANEAKNVFISRMSHELRTPLNAILGFSQLLNADVADRDRENVEQIIRSGRHLLKLIDEVLDFARVEAGRTALSLQPLAVADVVGKAIDQMRPTAAERRISLDASKVSRTGYFVLADREKLTQVLINLLTNAIQYNREGGRVTVDCVKSAEGRVRISVNDTGEGMTSEQTERLFKPFERLEADRKGIPGSGLGLALSKLLVEGMNGTLGVESVPGEGSTFWCELNGAETGQADVPLAEVVAGTTPSATAAYRVLLIEDNLSNVRLIQKILRRRPDVALLTATEGTLGLEMARTSRPDLILLDVNLPDLEGNEVLAQMQKDSALVDVPVIVVSADGTSQRVQQMLAGGAREYVAKPFDVQQLLATLEKYVPSSAI